MKLLKTITLASALYFSSCAAPQIRESAIPARIPVPDEDRVSNEQRPSYLTQLPPEEVLANMTPVEKLVLQYTQNARDMQNNIPGLLFTNGSPKRVVTINGRQVSIELPYYRLEGNQLRNIINNSVDNQEMIYSDFQTMLSRANDIVFEHFQQIDANANRRVVQRIGGISDESASIEDLEGVTLGTALGIQNHPRTSLLPNKFILGDLDRAYAITKLHENVIVYSPMARQVDEIWGQPGIVAHEFWHLSQSIVDALGTNVELYAYSVNLNLSNSNPLTFLAHPYGAEARELAKTYYGFDSQQVISNSISNRIANLVELDENVLQSNYQNTSRLATRFGNALHNEVEPEYASFSPYWIMMQQYYQNRSLLLRLAISKDGVPVGMTRTQRTQFLIQKKQVMEQIFNQVDSEYVPPRIMELGPFRIVDGVTIEDLIERKCHAAGFNDAQTEYTFHLFLKRKFFNADGTYNYSNISLNNAASSMHTFSGRFENITNEELNQYFPNTTPEVRRLFNLYKWYNQRLDIATRYHNFAEEQGLTPEDNFVSGIFDPRFNLEGFYNVRPEYTKNTSNMSLRSTRRERISGIEYRINNYDFVNDRGNADGVDFVSVFRIKNGRQETNPCMIVFASNNSRTMNFALRDNDREGQPGYGIYDNQIALTENTTIESLLTTPVITATPAQQNHAQPQHGNFVPPEYSSWQSRMEEYDADLDSRIDSIAVFYQNGGRQVKELYQIPREYDGAFITEQGIMLSKRGLFEMVHLNELDAPYALQITENGSTRTLFDSNGYGTYRQMITR